MSDDFLGVLAEQGLVPATGLAAFVVGSTARGWAHHTSDVDLVVVCGEPFEDDRTLRHDVPLEPDHLPVVAFQHADRRWEVKYWLDGQVDQLLAKVGWDRFGDDRTVGHRLAEVETLFLSRLRTCLPVSGRLWIERRRGQLDGSAFRSLLMMQALTDADEAAEDSVGQLAAGEAHGAVLSARNAFGYAVEALLISHGDYEANLKWRARRFRAAAPALLSFVDYWAIETMRDLEPDRPGEWVERVIELCKTVSMEVEV